MMISKEKQFLFLHIPKTGGTSLLGQLEKYCSPHYGGHPQLLRYIENNKKQYPDIEEYYKFTIVRNPWDRLVSAFFFLQEGGNQNPHDIAAQRTLSEYSFEKFVEVLQSNPRYFNHIVHLKPQMFFIQDFSKINQIINIEKNQEQCKLLKKNLNLKIGALPHKNKSKHKHYTEYYDDETKSIVAEKYAKDIEYFSYEFGE